jgi:hypothetical protein
MATHLVRVNRAPVLTLWAAVVAERLGFDEDEALTLGRAVAGLNAQSKGRRLGIFEPSKKGTADARRKRAPFHVELLGRHVPARNTADGVRATKDGAAMDPESVRRYLHGKLGGDHDRVRASMRSLAAAFPPKRLAEEAYELYEAFRPAVPAGKKGWGVAGDLNLRQLRGLVHRAG